MISAGGSKLTPAGEALQADQNENGQDGPNKELERSNSVKSLGDKEKRVSDPPTCDDMCISMIISMRIKMCISMRISMCISKRISMHISMRNSMHNSICISMCISMSSVCVLVWVLVCI